MLLITMAQDVYQENGSKFLLKLYKKLVCYYRAVKLLTINIQEMIDVLCIYNKKTT